MNSWSDGSVKPKSNGAVMKPNVYRIVEMCVNSGVMFGVNRAFKHKESLTLEDSHIIRENVQREIMNELCEYFHFDDARNDSY